MLNPSCDNGRLLSSQEAKEADIGIAGGKRAR